MENRVYYGEYSLAYWLELILNQKITLPAYQRHFVWDEEKMNALICSIKEERFIPPLSLLERLQMLADKSNITS